MVTLLLTFLVLIISITTMDPRNDLLLSEGELTRREDQLQTGDGLLLYSDWGMLAPVIELAENLDRLPEEVMFDQKEIKDAIFQLDPAKTPDFGQLAAAADEGLTIFKDNRGLVVQWDRSLLFPEGDTRLFDANLALLQKLAVFLNSLNLPLSIEGHTDPSSALEGGLEPAAYDLSFRRAKAVMEYLVSLGLAENRFRLAGHGGSHPRTTDPDLAFENSRLEIIIYQPEPSSLIGR
jgi:chemotaxis protein MotB